MRSTYVLFTVLVAAACSARPSAPSATADSKSAAISSISGASVQNHVGPVVIKDLLRQHGIRRQYSLVLVDGYKMKPEHADALLSGLTYGDIKSVDVVKDLASTVSYGLEAHRGVLLIKTKRKP